jgi:trehalose synthase
LLRRDHGTRAIWRSHIGLDRSTPETEAAWAFLRPWLEQYDRTVFTIGAYAPDYLEDRVEVARPGIDPLSHKNRELSIHKHAGILVNASLSATVHPAVSPPFEFPALRLQEDGSFAPATQPEGLGLMFRPVLTQVSRWDRLKGFGPLLEGFARLKRKAADDGRNRNDRHRRRLELARLVLAGPDPKAVDDDPEGWEVFSDLCDRWLDFPPDLRRDVALIRLPMESRKANALMVNVLQRSSVAVVQNSLEEGFGLTVTEAMWKGVSVLGSTAAGIAAQVEDGETGRLIEDPEDPIGIAERLDEMLESEKKADAWATNARRNVADRFLVTAQVTRWLELFDETVTRTQIAS